MYSKKTRPLVVAGIILHSYHYALVVIARDSTNTHKASKASDKMRVMHMWPNMQSVRPRRSYAEKGPS